MGVFSIKYLLTEFSRNACEIRALIVLVIPAQFAYEIPSKTLTVILEQNMAKNPSDRRYTKTHEWVRPDGDLVTIGITDFAQHQLSDVTFVELPVADTHFTAGSEAIVVESIKAAADVYAPVSGTIVELNTLLADEPGLVNTDPFGAGWLVKMKPDNPRDIDKLMQAAEYEATLPKE